MKTTQINNTENIYAVNAYTAMEKKKIVIEWANQILFYISANK